MRKTVRIFTLLLLQILHQTYYCIQVSPKPRRLFQKMGQGISTAQWFVYGKRNFTETGYLRHVKKYCSPIQGRADVRRGVEGADGVDLGGKVVVVTG